MDGVFVRGQATALDEITDGSSNTIMVGERPPAFDKLFGWWYAGVGQFPEQTSNEPYVVGGGVYPCHPGKYTASGDYLLGAFEILVGGECGDPRIESYNSKCELGAYKYQPGQIKNICDTWHFWSLHPHGSNFLFADGAVRFVSYDIGEKLAALATIKGSEAYAGALY